MTIDPLYFVLAYFGIVGLGILFWLGAARLNERYDRTSP